MSEAKAPVKQNELESFRKSQKKSLLFSSNDLSRMAEQSSRARLMKQVVGTDDLLHETFEKPFYSKNAETENEVTECKEYVTGITVYPSRVGLRWNPCVEVSSGEDIPIHLEPQKSKNHCNCANCTSKHCPSKHSFGFSRTGFRDNIMKFSDKTTMTPKLNHASCNARTPSVSPKPSSASVSGSQSSYNTACYYPPPPPTMTPHPSFKKPKGVLRVPCYDPEPYYDEVEKDTDVYENCTYVKKLNRHCISNYPNLKLESIKGKRNLYNEGISDKVAEQYPVTPPQCPHRVMFGAKSFCGNMCPNCCCMPPTTKGSRPVYYDLEPEEMQNFVAIPRVVLDRYVAPIGRAHRAPSIILPKKMLTSERDIEMFVMEQKAKRKHKKGR
ncbi:uncharacterized protein LOC128676574 isoform X2 [Plodia interpunctella]|uniref:uncharacterized protein LOC128676574 isoform X2 n=1 Tax=Plodia interpunctella TaxID=58824 RepID=UPI002368A5E2|nr:uncharacterized protein LOC128676574 isoform X2 [Plodia interpunctella]